VRRPATVLAFALAVLPALALAPAAAAQQESTAGGLMLSVSGGYLGPRFSESLRAVSGSSGGVTFGGEVGFIFGDHLALSVGAHHFSKDGERVFVSDPDGTVFKLGHPLKVKLVPARATLAWRFFEKRSAGILFTPYLGAGGGVTSYHEESTIAGEQRVFDVTKASAHVLAGLELGGSRVRFAVELGYSTAPNALGDNPDGVSRVYGEKDIGGFTALGKIVFNSGRR
jgi:opacity protein-like surface antigen